MLRLPGLADGPSVVDQQVGEVAPFLLRDDGHKVNFDLDRVGLLREAEQIGQALYVGIDGDAFVDAEGGGEDDVRGLARDAGKRDELFHGAGDDAAESVQQHDRCLVNALRLVVEEIYGVDVLRDLLRLRLRECLHACVFLEQARRDLVHLNVGGLCGQDRGHHQFEGRSEPQGGQRGPRVFLLQPPGNYAGFFAVGHKKYLARP